MPTYTLRRLTEADAPAFRELRLRALREHPDMYSSSVEDWQDKPLDDFARRLRDTYAIGGFLDETLVGMALVALQARPREKSRHKCEIWSVYVAPEQRGAGLARQIMEAAIAECRERGFSAVVLGVAGHNAPAVTLYRNLGFVEFGREPDAKRLPDGRSFDEVMMQLVL